MGAPLKMTEPPNESLWPWLILHGDHVAWYQRALLSGDFAPASRPQPNYVHLVDGTLPDPGETPRCGTCGEEPRVEDLTPVERATGQRGFLDAFRLGRMPWQQAGRTRPETCYACNDPSERLSQDSYIKLCRHCEEHLRKGGE